MLLAMPAFVSAEMTVPELESGDKWTYEVEMTESGMKISGDWTYEVKGEKTVSGHEVYDMSLDGEGSATMEIPSIGTATMDFTVEGYHYLRTNDLATVKENMTMEMSTSLMGIEVSIQMFLEMSYDPPMNDFGFPLDVGKEWTSTSSATTTSAFAMTMGDQSQTESETDTESETSSFKCESTESISVSAGTFESYKTNQSEDDDSYVHNYVSEESGMFVKSEVYDEDGELQVSMQLKSYSYGEGQDVLDLMDYLWLIIVIVIIVVVIAAVAGVRSRRSKREIPPPPPPEEI